MFDRICLSSPGLAACLMLPVEPARAGPDHGHRQARHGIPGSAERPRHRSVEHGSPCLHPRPGCRDACAQKRHLLMRRRRASASGRPGVCTTSWSGLPPRAAIRACAEPRIAAGRAGSSANRPPGRSGRRSIRSPPWDLATRAPDRGFAQTRCGTMRPPRASRAYPSTAKLILISASASQFGVDIAVGFAGIGKRSRTARRP